MRTTYLWSTKQKWACSSRKLSANTSCRCSHSSTPLCDRQNGLSSRAHSGEDENQPLFVADDRTICVLRNAKWKMIIEGAGKRDGGRCVSLSWWYGSAFVVWIASTTKNEKNSPSCTSGYPNYIYQTPHCVVIYFYRYEFFPQNKKSGCCGNAPYAASVPEDG